MYSDFVMSHYTLYLSFQTFSPKKEEEEEENRFRSSQLVAGIVSKM